MTVYTCINERTNETAAVNSIPSGKNLCNAGFTRFVYQNISGKEFNWIYRRKPNGQMTWMDEDENLEFHTFDDGKGKLEVHGLPVESINKAIEYSSKLKSHPATKKDWPDTIWITYDGHKEVRLRWNKSKRLYTI